MTVASRLDRKQPPQSVVAVLTAHVPAAGTSDTRGDVHCKGSTVLKSAARIKPTNHGSNRRTYH